RDSLERKRQTFSQIARSAVHHLWLVSGAAIVRRDEVITVYGDHRDHGWLIAWFRFYQERASVGCDGIGLPDWRAVLKRLPLARKRRQLFERSVALRLVPRLPRTQ